MTTIHEPHNVSELLETMRLQARERENARREWENDKAEQKAIDQYHRENPNDDICIFMLMKTHGFFKYSYSDVRKSMRGAIKASQFHGMAIRGVFSEIANMLNNFSVNESELRTELGRIYAENIIKNFVESLTRSLEKIHNIQLLDIPLQTIRKLKNINDRVVISMTEKLNLENLNNHLFNFWSLNNVTFLQRVHTRI